MSAEPTTDLDADIRAAFAALDAQVASRPEYLASFESRLLARMEEQAVTESTNQSAVSEMGDASSPERPRTKSTEESSGLHDIRALAQSAKMRISQNMSEARRDSSLLASSSLALRVVALPDQAKQQVYAGAAAAGRSGESDESQPLPAWIYAAIGAVAAAAVVFFILRGGQGAGERAVINQAPAPSQPTLGMERAVVPAAPEPSGELAAGALPTDDGEAAGADVGGAREPADPADPADSKPPAGAVARDERDESAKPKDEASTRTASAQRAGSSKKESGGSSGGAPDSKAGVAPAATTGAKTGAVTGAAPDGTAADSQQSATKTSSDPIEALFSETSASSAKPQGAGSGVPTRTKLDTGDLRKAMAPLQGKADACFDKHQVPGQVMIRFSVAPSGEVISASATGQFQGTDTGKCVADVVKSASFPAFDGAQMSFNYPFLLAQ